MTTPNHPFFAMLTIQKTEEKKTAAKKTEEKKTEEKKTVRLCEFSETCCDCGSMLLCETEDEFDEHPDREPGYDEDGQWHCVDCRPDEDYPGEGCCGRCSEDNNKGGTALWNDLCDDCDNM
jgi:hypothetical protein